MRPKVFVFAIPVLLLAAACAYAGKWSYDRLKASEQVFLYLTTPPQGPDGKPLGAQTRAQFIDQLYATAVAKK
jgi:hypothetical protein